MVPMQQKVINSQSTPTPLDIQRAPPRQPAPPSANPTVTRRHLSVALFAAAPILDAVSDEAKLWQQELELYGRRAQSAASATFSDVLPSKPASSAARGKGRPTLDAEFAAALLKSISDAAGAKAAAVQADAKNLAAKELPYYQKAGTCGHCGTNTGPSALKDKDFFDFQSYVQGKALLRSCGAKNADDTIACAAELRLAMGKSIFTHILGEVDVNEAEAVGISPFRASTATSAALLSASPELDSIRIGVKALLKYFEKKGFISSFGISQFGLSTDEYENHMVWARGEPAYLQYWLVNPTDLKSTAALQSEEGAALGFVSAAIEAYLVRCGVESEGLQRVASLTDSNQVSEQLTLRRVKSLQKNGSEKSYKAWKPDACPNGAETDCF